MIYDKWGIYIVKAYCILGWFLVTYRFDWFRYFNRCMQIAVRLSAQQYFSCFRVLFVAGAERTFRREPSWRGQCRKSWPKRAVPIRYAVKQTALSAAILLQTILTRFAGYWIWFTAGMAATFLRRWTLEGHPAVGRFALASGLVAIVLERTVLTATG